MNWKILTTSTLFTLLAVTSAERDGKWVWGDSSRQNNARDDDSSRRSEASARYEVFEPNYPLNNYNGNRPQIGQRPFQPGPVPVVPQRPGGAYGQGGYGQGGYGQGGYGQRPLYTEVNRPGSGQGLPFNTEGPFKEFDYCKCAEKFNCESPGISYGHCDAGKKYCCYSRKPGGPTPSRPVHSPENGVLVGPGGPIDPIPGVNPGFNPHQRPYNRPGGYLGGAGYYRPGAGGFGLGGRPDGYVGRPDGYVGRPDGFINRPEGYIGRPSENTYSIENGILVGPGGPIDRPYPGQFDQGFRSRSAKNKTN